jgi:hypothetical protein
MPSSGAIERTAHKTASGAWAVSGVAPLPGLGYRAGVSPLSNAVQGYVTEPGRWLA